MNQFLRVFALYGRDRRIAALLSLSFGAVVSLGIVRYFSHSRIVILLMSLVKWAITRQEAQAVPSMKCHVVLSFET